MKAAITATAKFLPEKVVTNYDLEKVMETTNDWIIERTGIHERRFLDIPEKATAYMCGEVAKKILTKRGITAEEIDMIIVATVTPDMMFPSTACLVQDIIGAKNAWGFDILAACSGFIFALNVGSKYIESGMHKKVLVLGGDKMSSILDFKDRSTAVIFGDGAGGVLLEPSTSDDYGILFSKMYTDGEKGKEALYMPAGGSLLPASEDSVKRRLHSIFQEGQMVFKSAVTKMADVAEEVVVKSNLKSEDIAYLIPHQANLRIIKAAADRLKLNMDKVCVNIHKYGNTTAGTISIALAELDEENKLHDGANLILVSFGAGYTWGGLHIRWKNFTA